jgi:4-carboxymuconolactone decarboxylase
MEPRIAPLQPPDTPAIQTALDRWMPPGRGEPPLSLFRTVVRHEHLSERMRGLGAVFLGPRSLVPPRVRELLVLRTSARCGAEYEWGVHVAGFAALVGLDPAAVRATTLAPPATEGAARSGAEAGRASSTTDSGDALVLALADELHDTSTVSAPLWARLAAAFEPSQLLEMIAIAGFYHLIAYTVNALAIEHEPWAARLPPPTDG